jgi:hypothetical protein
MTPENLKIINGLSRKLQKNLLATRDEFLKEHAKLDYETRTYVALDACAAIMAEWSCSTEAAHNSTMDIPSSIGASVELLQYNFMQKQKELYDHFGRYVQ